MLLARIDNVRRDQPLLAGAIHPGVRRPLSRYRFTTITGISWQNDDVLSLSQFVAGLSMYGALPLLPLYYQKVRGASALTAGLLMVPQGGGSLLPRTVAGRLSRRGERGRPNGRSRSRRASAAASVARYRSCRAWTARTPVRASCQAAASMRARVACLLTA